MRLEPSTFLGRSAYSINFTSVFFICRCARDTSEASKNLFSNGANRIGRGFRHDPAVARSDVKRKKSLTATRLGAFTTS
jgi:hypothetical protein